MTSHEGTAVDDVIRTVAAVLAGRRMTSYEGTTVSDAI